MIRVFAALMAMCLSAQADILLRDEHQDRSFRFESNARNVHASASEDEITEEATEWAVVFYSDETLEVIGVDFKTEPLRFWLVTFRKSENDEKFFAVLLPDGQVVEPDEELGI
jgi:hypothetical protein